MSFVKALTIMETLRILGIYGAAYEDWIQISPNIAFQSRVESAKNNAQMIRAKNSAIDRILKQQGNTTFYSSPYSIGMEDMNGEWNNVQMAWHLLGFYVDCVYNSDYEKDDYQKRVLHEERQQKDDQEHQQKNSHGDYHHEEDHRDDRREEEEVDKNCTRKVMYAVVSFVFK